MAKKASSAKKRRRKKKPLGRACLLGVDGKPESPCTYGENRQCAWWISGQEHDYCMWVFLREKQGPSSLKVIGDQLSVCRERIRQIEEAALEKLRAQIPLAPHDLPSEGSGFAYGSGAEVRRVLSELGESAE